MLSVFTQCVALSASLLVARRHVPLSPASHPSPAYGQLILESQCLLDIDMEILDIEPELGEGWATEQKPPWTQPVNSSHRVSLPKAGNFPSLGAWAGFQLVPWRGEASYPITSLLSQPVPPGLRSYKHQPVLRGELRRAPHWFQMEKRLVWGNKC